MNIGARRQEERQVPYVTSNDAKGISMAEFYPARDFLVGGSTR